MECELKGNSGTTASDLQLISIVGAPLGYMHAWGVIQNARLTPSPLSRINKRVNSFTV